MHRRRFLHASALGAVAAPALSPSVLAEAAVRDSDAAPGAIATAYPEHVPGQGIPPAQQSVSRWCYGYLPLERLLPELKEIGLSAIDLITPKDWPVLRDHGFTCSMAYGREDEDITTGFIDAGKHDELYSAYAKTIPQMAEYGYENLVCFAGNRRGQFDLDGLRTAAKGLRRLMPIAEEHGVTLQMEAFNSKVDHPDYMGDSTAWLVTLCDLVDSDHFKILFDIYHMQVQEGNVIATIRAYHDYFGHYHTAGVPGRHELNDEQELYYPAVMRAVRATGFACYVAHEFVPTYEDKLSGLREAVRVCA